MLRVHRVPAHPSARSTKEAFPSVYDPASILVSVVVPAYNEEKRITTMMDEMLEYLRKEERKDKCVSAGASVTCGLAPAGQPPVPVSA